MSEADISANNPFRRQPKATRLLARDVQFSTLARPVVVAPLYGRLKALEHHDATLADHSVSVAYHAFVLARALGLRGHLGELTRGALLHDFFLYDWRTTRPPSGGLHGFAHPREALHNAEAVFGPLSRLERDIILRHMWPLTPVPPRYAESFIVCLVDKCVSTIESWRALRNGRGLGVL